MDAKGREASVQKEKYTIDQLLELYSKGYQLVSYGLSQQIEVPGVGLLTFRKYPSGDTYCVRPNGALEKVTDAWFDKIKRLVKDEQERNAKKNSKRI